MLPKENRLKKKKDFERVAKERGPTFGDFLVLKKSKNGLERSRFGFVVSLKVSKKATQRNRIKRILREVIREFLPSIKKGYDVVFFTKKDIKSHDHEKIKEAVENILKKAKLLD